MGNLVVRILTANYEDYDKYDETSCTLKHWPDMWPEEIAAEAALYEERMERNRQMYFMAQDNVQRTIMHFKRSGFKRWEMDELKDKALMSLADEHGWKVKNGDCVRYDKVTPIIATRHCEDEVLEDIENFMKREKKLKRKLQMMKHSKAKPNHKRAFELALLSLIEEQGWQRVETYYNNKVFYHYKT